MPNDRSKQVFDHDFPMIVDLGHSDDRLPFEHVEILDTHSVTGATIDGEWEDVLRRDGMIMTRPAFRSSPFTAGFTPSRGKRPHLRPLHPFWIQAGDSCACQL
jgi:hypothetical protein